jgi:hypothetical protein
MTDDGKIPCGLCKQWLYIGEFYCLPVDEGTRAHDIWWGDPNSGRQFGRPKSYCKACNRATTRGKKTFQEYMKTLETSESTRITDPVRAESKAYIERARRMWNEAHPDQAYDL